MGSGRLPEWQGGTAHRTRFLALARAKPGLVDRAGLANIRRTEDELQMLPQG
jgi:hypothetical protein